MGHDEDCKAPLCEAKHIGDMRYIKGSFGKMGLEMDLYVSIEGKHRIEFL